METFTYRYKQQKQRGFTLAELLVVIAIIGILTAISIPIFTSQLEKSREATDMANVRSAYAEVMVAANSGEEESKVVQLKQKQDGWQTPQKSHKIMIGGITEDNKDNWIGNPLANGTCKVYYDPKVGPVLQWSREFVDPYLPFNEAGLKEYVKSTYGSNANLEIDSGCESTMVKMITDHIKTDANRIDLLKKDENGKSVGTWAYMGSVKEKDESNRYFFWTSVNINKDGFQAGTVVPMIIGTAKGDFYISFSETQTRNPYGKPYNVLIKSTKGTTPTTITDIAQYRKIYIDGNALKTSDGKPQCFTNLNDAYDAYVKFVKGNYPDYADTLLSFQ